MHRSLSGSPNQATVVRAAVHGPQALWISCLATTLSFLNSWKCKAEKVYVGFLECVLSQREATREKTPVDPRLALLESEYALRATISVQAKIEGELTAVLQEEVCRDISRSASHDSCRMCLITTTGALQQALALLATLPCGSCSLHPCYVLSGGKPVCL